MVFSRPHEHERLLVVCSETACEGTVAGITSKCEGQVHVFGGTVQKHGMKHFLYMFLKFM